MKIKSYIDFITIDFLYYQLLISWGMIKLVRFIDKRKYNSYKINITFNFHCVSPPLIL